ncbi:lipase 3-like [Eurosta solidaginis]|uniref:lipase 3-like n=1 Tax=Eurosta solidaginis TaxID=178769 RepID=UPI0035314A6F
MSANTFKVVVLFLLATFCSAQEFASSVTTESLVGQHGYPLETHEVQTSDGYILTMYRIPYSPKLKNSASQRPVALVMHGFLCASSIWFLNGPDESLPYMLSNAGYDVWLPNARGTRYSRKHVTLSSDSEDFWKFDWHEIGVYDQPALIDYALNVTGEDQLYFIGHSEGTTAFFVMGSLFPSMLDRIRSAHLLAPVAYMINTKSSLFVVGGSLLVEPSPFINTFPNTELFASSRSFELITTEMCKDGSMTQNVCTNLFLDAFGLDSPYHNNTKMPELFAVYPSGASINQYQHFAQLYFSGKFRQFDYGVEKNLEVYGTTEPPDYNLENLDVPMYAYYSDNDYLAELSDSNRLFIRLKTLKRAYRVPETQWNHFDFVTGKGVGDVVYKVLLEDMAKA